MSGKLRKIAASVRTELKVYRLILVDKRTPWLARALLGAAVAYALSPIDIIPDFIPVIGHVDDLIIVPLLVIAALKLIPKRVIADCRARVADEMTSARESGST